MSRASPLQKSASPRLCARAPPYFRSMSSLRRNCEPAKVENTSWRWKPSLSSATRRSPASVAPYAPQPLGPAMRLSASSAAVASGSARRASALAIALAAMAPPPSSARFFSPARVFASA